MISNNLQAKKRGRNKVLPNINWGRGRLRKYESFASFAAKFCRLNSLDPIDFREYWNSIANIFTDQQEEKKLSFISRFLDEPKPIVRTVFEHRQLDRSWNPKLQMLSRDWDIHISYCPECLSKGFHGNFHESEWLEKCPIHHIDLTRDALLYSPLTKVDRYLVQLTALLDLKCPGWDVSFDKNSPKIQPTELRLFNIFLDWRKAAEKSLPKCPERCIGKFGNNIDDHNFNYEKSYSEYSRDCLMENLGWLTPIPKEIHVLFIDSPYYKELEIQRFPNTIGRELRTILSLFKWEELLYLFCSAHIVKRELRNFQRIAEVAIINLNFEHPSSKCNCIWGTNKDGGLINCLPGELKYYVDYHCPYRLVMSELHENWFNLISDNQLSHFRNLGRYQLLAVRAKVNEIASVLSNELGGKQPILEFHWSDELSNLLDTILEKMLLARICELNIWLESIINGESQSIRNHFPNSTYLVHDKFSGMRLISWPPGGINKLKRF